MRHRLAWLVVVALTRGATAQFDEFTWTLQGNPTGSGWVQPDVLHVTGPDGACDLGTTTWFETVAPYPATVSILVDYITLDDWGSYKYFDAPAWVIDGVTFTPWSDTGWNDGTYTLEFEVLPGQTFGFGIWAWDCCCGPGIGDFRDLVVVPHEWFSIGAAIDPQLGPEAIGQVVDGVGDVNGDGGGDFVTGDTSDLPGVVQVRSGLDGSLLFEKLGDGKLGASIAGPGDLDGDGTHDVAAGAPWQLPGTSGAVHAWRGHDGAELFVVTGASTSAKLGSQLAGPGDLDGDGLADLAVHGKLLGEQVLLIGGPDGHPIGVIGAAGGLNFGAAMDGPGDVDLDGVPDLLVGRPATLPEGIGRAYVHSGATQAQLLEFVGTTWKFGSGVAGAGDVDSDGVPDVVVSESTLKVGPATAGAVTVYSGNGSLLYQLTGSPGLALAAGVAGGADLSGDGSPDLVTALDTNPPVLQVRDAAQGAVLSEIPALEPFTGDPGVAIVGNVDGLGTEDAALVATSIQVFKALDGHGAPTLAGSGNVAANEDVVLTISDGLAGAPAVLVIGSVAAQVPLLGGILQPQPQGFLALALGGDGSASVHGRWPPGLPANTSAWFQAWIVDPAGPQGWTASSGLIATQVGP